MKAEDVEISVGGIDRPHQVVGPIKVRVKQQTAFSRSRTLEEVDSKLREEALKRGANAVMHVQYHRGFGATSFKALDAKGIAVVAESLYIPCPLCREPMRRDASVCPHCRNSVVPQ